jgi:hypothetical protein
MLKLFTKKLRSPTLIDIPKMKSLYTIVTWFPGQVSQRNFATDDDQIKGHADLLTVYIIETFSMLVYPRQLSIRCQLGDKSLAFVTLGIEFKFPQRRL